MNGKLFGLYAINNPYHHNDYSNLSEEEIKDLNTIDEMLFSDNERINNAAFHLMLLILKLRDNYDKYSIEDVQYVKNRILEGLSDEEKEQADKFAHACINSIGVFAREEKTKKLERKNDR